MTEPTPAIDRMVVARGAAMALIFAVPAALANGWLAEQDPKPKGALNLTLLVLIAAFVLGGFLAGAEAKDLVAKHGALAGVAAFVPVEAIGILSRLDRGDPVSIGGIIFLGLLAASAGTLGALLGARRRATKDAKRARDALDQPRGNA